MNTFIKAEIDEEKILLDCVFDITSKNTATNYGKL